MIATVEDLRSDSLACAYLHSRYPQEWPQSRVTEAPHWIEAARFGEYVAEHPVMIEDAYAWLHGGRLDVFGQDFINEALAYAVPVLRVAA